MLTHGWGKFKKLINGDFQFADPIGIGPELSLVLTSFSEFICAILIIIGLKSRIASIPLILTMLVAAFIVHAEDPIGKKEFPLLYLAMFLGIFLMGSGKYSIDGLMKKTTIQS
jgi:putative oxidoreductase